MTENQQVNPIHQPVNPYAAQMKEEQQKFYKELDAMLREQVTAVFCNPHGLQLLNTLEDIYIRQPVCPAGCIEGYGYMREGENRLILKIRRIVNQAQKATA